MRAVSSFVAVTSLFQAVALFVVIGGAIFGLVLFFPLFLLALVGVLAGLEDRTVHQHNPSMDPNAWGDG
jgi:hypothetical protein